MNNRFKRKQLQIQQEEKIKEEKTENEEKAECEEKAEGEDIHAYQLHQNWNHMWGPTAGEWPAKDSWRYIDLFTCLSSIMLEYYNSPKFKTNLRRYDKDRQLPNDQIRRHCFICVVCYKHTGGQSPFFCTFLEAGGIQKHYKNMHNKKHAIPLFPLSRKFYEN